MTSVISRVFPIYLVLVACGFSGEVCPSGPFGAVRSEDGCENVDRLSSWATGYVGDYDYSGVEVSIIEEDCVLHVGVCVAYGTTSPFPSSITVSRSSTYLLAHELKHWRLHSEGRFLESLAHVGFERFEANKLGAAWEFYKMKNPLNQP